MPKRGDVYHRVQIFKPLHMSHKSPLSPGQADYLPLIYLRSTSPPRSTGISRTAGRTILKMGLEGV